MSKTVKGLLIAALCVLSLWIGMACLYTHTVSEELETLRRESRSDTVYLRGRIRDLESALAEEKHLQSPSLDTAADDALSRLPRVEPSEPPSESPIKDTPREPSVTTAPSDASVSDKPSRPPQDSLTADVTLPVLRSPETLPPSEETTEALPSLYLVAEQNGIIGLFDASGGLLRSVNVFVLTLPPKEQEALAVGIPAASFEEALEILNHFS